MSADSAELVFSMLFGDRSELDGELRDVFQASGLAHILSVSGMHVGLIIILFVFLLNAMKFPRKWQIPILFAVLAFYVYLVDFRYAVIRASIMFMIFVINKYYLRKGDLFSSMCFAGIIILLIFPFGLTSVSFLLTFGCLLGIALFFQPISTWLKKRLPKKIAEPIALYISVYLITFPIIINTFGFFSIVGIITNLVLLPLMVIAFQISAIALLTVVGFPLLWVADLLVRFVVMTSEWLGSQPWSVLRIQGSGYLFVLWTMAMVLSSRFVFTSRRVKFITFSIFMLGYLLTIGIVNL